MVDKRETNNEKSSCFLLAFPRKEIVYKNIRRYQKYFSLFDAEPFHRNNYQMLTIFFC